MGIQQALKLPVCMLLFTSCCALFSETAVCRHAVPSYWELTRKSDVVVIGVVTNSGKSVVLTATESLKNTKSIPTASVTFSPLANMRFAPGASWLVFIKVDAAGRSVLLSGVDRNIDEIRQTVLDVLSVDGLKPGSEKCRALVRLAVAQSAYSSGQALLELEQYNKPEHLDLLAPLGKTASTRHTYIQLLRNNAHEKTTGLLLGFLDTEQGRLLTESMLALSWKERENEDLSEKLLSFIDHTDPDVRWAAVFVLSTRDYRKAFPEIVRCLDDPSSRVRATALYSWPWYAYDFEGNPGTRRRIGELTHDPDDRVRSAACRALVSGRVIRYLYALWYRALFDGSRIVRDEIALDLLFADRPLTVLLMLFWPTLFVMVAFHFTANRGSKPGAACRRLVYVNGAGYLVGVCAGWFLGTYRVGNPFCVALVFTPALTVPCAMLLVMLCRKFRNRKMSDPPGAVAAATRATR